MEPQAFVERTIEKTAESCVNAMIAIYLAEGGRRSMIEIKMENIPNLRANIKDMKKSVLERGLSELDRDLTQRTNFFNRSRIGVERNKLRAYRMLFEPEVETRVVRRLNAFDGEQLARAAIESLATPALPVVQAPPVAPAPAPDLAELAVTDEVRVLLHQLDYSDSILGWRHDKAADLFEIEVSRGLTRTLRTRDALMWAHGMSDQIYLYEPSDEEVTAEEDARIAVTEMLDKMVRRKLLKSFVWDEFYQHFEVIDPDGFEVELFTSQADAFEKGVYSQHPPELESMEGDERLE